METPSSAIDATFEVRRGLRMDVVLGGIGVHVNNDCAPVN